MGLLDKAELLEFSHVVSERCGADLKIMALDERLGTDRLVRGDVVVNNGLKHSLLAIVKFHL